MKYLLLLATAFTFLQHASAQGLRAAPGNDERIVINTNYSKAGKLDSMMKVYAPSVLPGLSIAIYDEKEGWWASSAGYADMKEKTPMQTDHLQYLQSVSKTYMAVAILKLKEEGRIHLDSPLTKYLPRKYHRHIQNAGAVTVRMLLNHTSGIPDYLDDRQFMSDVVLNPQRFFTGEDCLKAISGKPLETAPGSKYRYVNTNYLVLALIADEITGDHAVYINEKILKPLQLKNTYYANSHRYLRGLKLPRSYWDVFNNGSPLDVTPFQQMAVMSSKGDDGIVCTTTDAVLFLKGLLEHKLLNDESMKEQMEWVKDEQGRNRYGMGIIHFDIGGKVAYGHGGGGVGAGCGLMYIPDIKTYLFFSTNLAVFPDGKLPEKAGEMRDALLGILLDRSEK